MEHILSIGMLNSFGKLKLSVFTCTAMHFCKLTETLPVCNLVFNLSLIQLDNDAMIAPKRRDRSILFVIFSLTSITVI